ncbi:MULTISPECIES: hypothetical protein [unclassified Cupriavidus]|jgi:hypothetical protein
MASGTRWYDAWCSHMIGSDNDRKMVASRVRDFLLAHPAALPASR